VEACNARIKTLRGIYEWISDKTEKINGISLEIVEKSEQTAIIENQRKDLIQVFSGKFIEKMADTIASADREFKDALVAEIQQNVKDVKVIVEKYNIEFDLLMEVLSKSLTEKINEVRQEERQKAQDAIEK
jgi:DNA mismatch repair ATPase MutS